MRFIMLNLLFSSSNDYSPLLTIALTSLLENNSNDFNCINVYILDNGINQKNRDNINSLMERYPCRIKFIKIDIAASFNNYLWPVENNNAPPSFATYARLFTPSLVPEDIDKILYLDCDALILGSFKELWEMDLGDYYCAGALEPAVNQDLKKEFWFFNVNNYINAGVLLINLKKWREDNVEEKFIEFLSAHRGEYYCADQGIINLLFDNKIKILPPKYNLIGAFQRYDYNRARKVSGIKTEFYTKEIVDESRENPVFVHFIGKDFAPWANKDNKYADMYKHYAKIANCEDIIQYKNEPIWKPHVLFKKSYDYVASIALIFVPSEIFVKRPNKKLIELFKNEEIKVKNYFKE